MTSTKTKKYINEVINHPYVGIGILPFVGDFVGHANNVNKSLFAEGALDKEEFEYLRDLIVTIERKQDNRALKTLIMEFKEYLR